MFAIVTIIMISSHSQIGVVDVSVTVFNDATLTIGYNSFLHLGVCSSLLPPISSVEAHICTQHKADLICFW